MNLVNPKYEALSRGLFAFSDCYSFELNQKCVIAELKFVVNISFSENSYVSNYSEAYRYSFNGKEKENEIASGDLDFGARIYDARLGRWLSVDAMTYKLPFSSPYVAFNNCPTYFIDPDGNYSTGDKTTSSSQYLKIFKMWEVAAREYLNANHGPLPRTSFDVPIVQDLLWLIDSDYRAPIQEINEVGRGSDKISNFSYNKNLGKYVDLGGFPLDAVHFWKCAKLAFFWPEWMVKWQAESEEEDQADSDDPNGRTSAFAPEDMLTNYLGIYFGSS